MEYVLTIIGFLIVFIGGGFLFIHFSMKRDEKKYQKKVKENEVEKQKKIDYLKRLQSEASSEEVKDLLFKLQNRWKIIYDRTPIRVSFCSRRYYSPTPPDVFNACYDRDQLTVKLMDLGVELEYPQ